MTRPGPLATAALAVGSFDGLLTVLLLPAICMGLGWVLTVGVLLTSPVGVILALASRSREPDPASRRAADQAVLLSGGSLAIHLFLLLLLGV